jgi:hypothetical protein
LPVDWAPVMARSSSMTCRTSWPVRCISAPPEAAAGSLDLRRRVPVRAWRKRSASCRQQSCRFRLGHVVDSADPADLREQQFHESNTWDRTAAAGSDSLSVQRVTGILIGDAQRQKREVQRTGRARRNSSVRTLARNAAACACSRSSSGRDDRIP